MCVTAGAAPQHLQQVDGEGAVAGGAGGSALRRRQELLHAALAEGVAAGRLHRVLHATQHTLLHHFCAGIGAAFERQRGAGLAAQPLLVRDTTVSVHSHCCRNGLTLSMTRLGC